VLSSQRRTAADNPRNRAAGARREDAIDRFGRRLKAGRHLLLRSVGRVSRSVGEPRQARSLAGETLGDDPYHQRLTLVHQLGDTRAPARLFRAGHLRSGRIARPQKAVGGLADIDEGGVHRRVETAYPAQIDAAERGRIAIAEMIDLPHLLAAQQGGAGLARKTLDEQRCIAHVWPLTLARTPNRPARRTLPPRRARPHWSRSR
jgi:hypothetical protein